MRPIFIAAATLITAIASPSYAATATASGQAVTLAPLSIVKYGDLEFGTIVAGSVASTVAIDATTDTRTVASGNAIAASGTTPAAARFYTYGAANMTMQIATGALPTLNRAGGGASMNVSALTLNMPASTLLTSASLIDIRVGGTLEVGANQPDGDYSGTFDVTVTYF